MGGSRAVPGEYEAEFVASSVSEGEESLCIQHEMIFPPIVT